MCSLTLLDPLRTRLPFGLRKRERPRHESPARRAFGERARAAEGGFPSLLRILSQELADLIVLERCRSHIGKLLAMAIIQGGPHECSILEGKRVHAVVERHWEVHAANMVPRRSHDVTGSQTLVQSRSWPCNLCSERSVSPGLRTILQDKRACVRFSEVGLAVGLHYRGELAREVIDR